MQGVEIPTVLEDNSVLIVNDDADQLSLMSSLLGKAGYSVVTAVDGIDGLTRAKRERPDLVISDATMPRLGGLEFCRELRADAGLETVPILLVTALQKEAEGAAGGLPAGGADWSDIASDRPTAV